MSQAAALSSAASDTTADLNPASGELLQQVPNTDFSQFPSIMESARKAQQQWAKLSFKQRGQYLKRMEEYIAEHAEELALLVSQSNGKTQVDALATEVLPCTLACQWYRKNTANILATRKRKGGSLLFFNKQTTVHYQPLGVIGIISPWNYPLSIPFGEILMALMAGNAILLKVAAATPSVGVAIERIIKAAGLPDGLFHHIVGSGSKTAQAFFEHGIDKLFFTGSVGVGKQLMAQAAETLTPVVLELGGNDAMIVLEDADLARAANGAAWAGYQNAGQSCGGVERIYVVESVYQQFTALLAEKTRTLTHGPSYEALDVDFGSLTTDGQLRTVEQHMEDALAKGANIAAQSQPKGNTENGFFYPATLLTDVTEDMLVVREETFGPILCVMPVANAEEAVARANQSNLALTSSIWTKNNKRGRALAEQLETGVTTINDHLYTHGLSETPWGGWKESGIGRSHGPEGLLEMVNTKVVNWDILPSKRNMWWHPHTSETHQALLNALRFVAGKGLANRLKSGIKLMPYMLKKMFTDNPGK